MHIILFKNHNQKIILKIILHDTDRYTYQSSIRSEIVNI